MSESAPRGVARQHLLLGVLGGFLRDVLFVLLLHVGHIEPLHLVDQVSEALLRKRTRLSKDRNLLTERHQHGDRTNLERPRKLPLRLCVDLREDDVLM